MDQNKAVLAMYDVRGKQDFIFRTNKIQEIVGASWLIRDVFDDYLFDAARGLFDGCKGIYSYKHDSGTTKFSVEAYNRHICDNYVGEVVYDGGGNFILLFKDMDTFKAVTYEFSKRIMEEIGSLRVLGTAVPIGEGFSDYKADIGRLYAEHRVHEACESKVDPWGCLPIVQVDRETSQPLVDYTKMLDGKNINDRVRETIKAKGIKGKLTKESFAKLLKYHVEMERIGDTKSKLTDIERDYYRKNEKILDNIVEEKGIDSQLAVVYIDGNNMGAQVQKATNDARDYESSIEKLRLFSETIQKTYVEEGIKAALGTDINSVEDFRVIVSAGDEINFVVKAKDAFDCAMRYLSKLRESDDASACAGISVFHSHASYADAYRIAEEACESGKRKMKEMKLSRASFIDFHIAQGAYGVSLESIRDRENGTIISRPWYIWGDMDVDGFTVTKYEDVKRMASLFNKYARSNIKGLAKTARKSLAELDLELKRIRAHASITDEEDNREWDWLDNLGRERKEYRRNLIYDISISYDLWMKNI